MDLATKLPPLFLFAGVAMASASCGAQPGAAPAVDAQARVTGEGKYVSNEQLPINQRFRTLDEYLAYLERDSHMDGKWYKQIRPGVYELQTGNLHIDNDTQQRIYTREELAKKFGFAPER